MEISAPVLLLTRPYPQSAEFAEACARQFGDKLSVLISPILRIENKDVSIELDRFRAVVVSSANALSACDTALRKTGLPIFCVGPSTAEAAREMGLQVLKSAATGKDLADRIVAAGTKGPILFLRGERIAFDITKVLQSHGIETDSQVVYRQLPLPLSNDAQDVLKGTQPVLLPVFSPRSAMLLGAQIGDASAPIHILAISEKASAPLVGKTSTISVAETPDRAGMLQGIAVYLRSRSSC